MSEPFCRTLSLSLPRRFVCDLMHLARQVPSVPVPEAAVTPTRPEPPLPTSAVISLSLTIVKEAAGTPPKLTLVVLLKLDPVIVMISPGAPEVGEKPPTTGNGTP